MARAFPFLAFIVLLTGCTPTYEDFSRENSAIFQGYMTGDVHTAKAALLQQEKLAAEHEARGNRGVDYQSVRLVLYGHLCGLSAFMGDTNAARQYHAKYSETLKDRAITFEELLAAAEKHDQMLKPKWREQR